MVILTFLCMIDCIQRSIYNHKDRNGSCPTIPIIQHSPKVHLNTTKEAETKPTIQLPQFNTFMDFVTTKGHTSC